MSPNFTILGHGKAGRALADALGGTAALETHEACPEGPVLLALPDGALKGYSSKFWGRCAHIGGSLHLEGVPSLHPLVSFDGEACDWRGVPLAVTGTPPKVILDAFISLGFIPFELPADLKPLYHACAVLTSGHAATLWVAADAILKSSGITLPGRGLLGLAESTLNNIAKHGPNGITGPFVRKDEATIQRDAQALPEQWRDLFVGLGGMVNSDKQRAPSMTEYDKLSKAVDSREPSMNSISFWAKTTTDKGSGEKKPGISVYEHMLNVGSVALALSETMPMLLDEFGLCGNNIAALAALHDLGKISPGFQRKCLAWLKENDLEVQDRNGGGDSAWSNHAKMTQIAIHKVLADMKIENKTAGYIAAMLGAHHGIIQDDPEIINNRKINEIQRKKYFNIDWISEWEKSIRSVIEYFKADLSCVNLNEDSPELWFLAGLTTISDWIGSDEKHFSPDITLPKDKRFAKAVEVVSEIGLTPPKIRGGLNFSELFGFSDETKPNNMQLKAIECIQGPGVYIIEAPMGMGKTEAALWAAYNLLSTGKARGIYFALPTQITSNRIHFRMKSFIDKIAPDSTPSRLIHGNSWLLTDDLYQPIEENPEDAKTKQGWFVGNKRSLIAPFGVGTIDQALLGVVAAKHFFLRHFALAGKVVILDEIHSYDLYTGTLVTRLVQTLKNLDCTVIILSATLTEKRRNELLQPNATVSSDSYPLITGFTKHGSGIPIVCECDKPNKKEVDIRFKNENSAQQEAIDAARSGSVVLWVCNTVLSSQEQYAKFIQYKDKSKDEFLVGLLHSRFPFWRREQLEGEWMRRLGKEEVNRPGCILVSTQIVEQSVDIDAELLITELAPTDMLLQRLGRLWRHSRENRQGKPIAIILEEKHTIEEYKTMNQKEIKDSLGSKSKVYFPDILLKSLEVWKQHETITIPDQIRSLLEATYQDDEDFPEAWLKFGCDRFGSEASKRFLAIRNSNYWQLQLDDEEGVQTRLNEIPTISVILCKQIETNHIILLDNVNIQFKNDKFDIELARTIHKNLVKIPRYHFNTILPEKKLQNYLRGGFAIGIVADGNVKIDGLKDGTTVQWSNEEGVKITRSGSQA